jgi:lipopolysaccharide export system protein LptA
MRGDRLVVDLASGISRVDAGKSHGPVRMLIQQQPQQQQQGSPSSAAPRLGPPRPFSSN